MCDKASFRPAEQESDVDPEDLKKERKVPAEKTAFDTFMEYFR